MFTERNTTAICLPFFLLFTSSVADTNPSDMIFSGSEAYYAALNSHMQIVINEVLYRREAAGKPEFIELFNRGNEPVHLDGWLLEDSEKIGRAHV